MSIPELSVVVPVFKEGEAVAPVLRALDNAVSTPHEILVVYDFDEDPTVPVIARLHADIPAIRGLRNDLGRGVLNAMKAGIAASQGKYVLISMADGSDEPGIVDLMVAMAKGGADVVSASRYMRGGHQIGGPLLKRLMSRTAGLTLHWFGGVATHDPTNNFKLYSRRLLDETPIESEAGFELALELTVKATLAGRRVAEVPTTWRDRTAGESNFKLRKWLPHYLRWYWIALRSRVAGRGARAGEPEQPRSWPARAWSVGLRVSIGLAILWFVLALLNLVWSGADTLTYYQVNLDHPYQGAAPGIGGAYLYSPAFAQLIALVRIVVPWAFFTSVWQAALLAGMVWMAGPFAILLTPWVIDELVQGNLQILIGVAIVIGIRRPAAWAFVLLTKVTPAVGLLYFIGRRDWRSLAVAVGATALVSAVSFVIAPQLWWDWFALLSANSGATHDGTMPGPLPVRLAVAALIAFVAGRREWPWLVPFACAISLPVAWWGGLVITGGAVRLWRTRIAEPATPLTAR